MIFQLCIIGPEFRFTDLAIDWTSGLDPFVHTVVTQSLQTETHMDLLFDLVRQL